MTNAAIYKEKRSEYLAGNISHGDFYQWLNEFIGVTEDMLPVDIVTIQKSTEPYFNDIALSRWDSSYSATKRAAKNAGIQGWSMSDNVCCVKRLARKLAAN